ncbi:MAG TPA: hypothetical protein VJU86_05485 [Pyrinomonadaceae bacterium]|nr:hypothetical protein [Pyrinomonadaceae bacterium]
MGDQGTSGPTHSTGVGKGEDIKDRDGKEAGRDDAGESGAGRPAGTSTARDSTSINPDDVESSSGGPSMPPA